MAFPTLVSLTALAATTGTSTTTYAPSLGFTASAGDMIVVAVAEDDAGAGNSHTWSGSWVRIYDSGTIGGIACSVGYLLAAGGETAVSTITAVNSDRWAAVCWRLTGADVPSLTATTGSSSTPDPPTHTPAGGSNDYYWLVACGVDTSAAVTVTAAPSSYTGLVESKGGTTTDAQIAGAARSATGSSENPGTFTMSGTETWTAMTISVPPSAPSVVLPTLVTARR